MRNGEALKKLCETAGILLGRFRSGVMDKVGDGADIKLLGHQYTLY